MDIPEYAPETGLRLAWEDDAVIQVKVVAGTVHLEANHGGLLSLARHFLTLAQPNVPDGVHLHMDELAPLEPGSVSLIIEKVIEAR
jgi:hypothetical protein